MNSEDYKEWKNHRLTKLFHQYLADYRMSLMEQWARGGLEGDNNLMALAKLQLAEDLIHMEDGAISNFYNTTKKEEVNE